MARRRGSASGLPIRAAVKAAARSTTRALCPSGHHCASTFTAHDADRVEWHSVQALGMPNDTVFSGAGRLIE